MKNLFSAFFIVVTISCNSQKSYKFDKNSNVICCANVSLQKISTDLEYELQLQIELDSTPKFKQIDLSKKSYPISIYLNKYEKGNTFVEQICNDVLEVDRRPKSSVKYEVISGKLIISKISFSDHTISVTVSDVVLRSKLGNTIKLPIETFDNLFFGWLAG